MIKVANIKVLLVGKGNSAYEEGLKSKIKSGDLGERFIWHEPVPNSELYRFYSAADVAVWPRAASIGQREAIACGLPLIISDDSLVTDLVGHNNGFVFKEGDAEHLAEVMQKLLEPGLRREMSINGRRFAEEYLSWGVIARQFMGLVGK